MKTSHINCPLPNSGIFISPNGNLSPCCIITSEGSQFIETSQFTTDANLLSVRESFANGRLLENPLCNECRIHEENGTVSHAGRISWLNKKDETASILPRYLDISFSNTCNYDCVMCNPYNSSKWEQFYKNNKNRFSFLSGHPLFNFDKMDSISYDQIDDIIKNWGPTLERVTVKGGEPFYDKKALYFIKRIAEVNPNLSLSFSTNGSILNDDILKTLLRFKNVAPTLSCDGIGKVYEWIRGGSWETYYNNMKTFSQHFHRSTVISVCLSVYNFLSMEELLDLLTDHGLRWQILVATNTYLNYNHIPKSIYDKIMPNLTKKHNVQFPWTKQEDFKYNNFIKFTEILNQRRGFNIQDIVPELNPLLQSRL